MKKRLITKRAGLLLVCLVSMSASVLAGQITVQVKSLASVEGVRFSPTWVGFHDGSFDTFDAGTPASSQIEMLAEDGNSSGISGIFTGDKDGLILGPGTPPIFMPGDIGSMTFDIDMSSDVYFSYLAMVVPSNDAFVGNDDPMAIQIVNNGTFTPITFKVYGSMVWDAGTEVNDEVPVNTALLGQTTPNTGVTEGANIVLHNGHMVPGNILAAYPDADFTVPGYEIAEITIIPEPATMSLMAIGAVTAIRKRKSK